MGAGNFVELALVAAIHTRFGRGLGAAPATLVGVPVEVSAMLSVCAVCNRTRGWLAVSAATA